MKAIESEEGLLRVPKNKYADENIVYRFKNRTIDLTKPIEVYKNLHKDMYSIRQEGYVVAHAKRLCIKDAEFVVSESGRQKVLKTKQKNVHAYIKGMYATSGMGNTAKDNNLQVQVTYNPYKDETFVSNNFTPQLEITKARFVIADEKKVAASYVTGKL